MPRRLSVAAQGPTVSILCPGGLTYTSLVVLVAEDAEAGNDDMSRAKFRHAALAELLEVLIETTFQSWVPRNFLASATH